MNRVISWLQSVRLRQILTVFLVSLTFLFTTAFDIHGNQLQAQAESVTPEATQYKVDNAETQAEIKAERIKENAEKSAKLLADEGKQVTNRAAESAKDPNKNIFDAVKEKLNLDEPIDPGTKKAVRQLEDAVIGKDD
jgi:predicted PurR-regulated permease PerM